MGSRNREGIGLSYRPARLHRLAKSIPWNRFLGSFNVYIGLRFLYVHLALLSTILFLHVHGRGIQYMRDVTPGSHYFPLVRFDHIPINKGGVGGSILYSIYIFPTSRKLFTSSLSPPNTNKSKINLTSFFML
jgi:hypothetical protein